MELAVPLGCVCVEADVLEGGGVEPPVNPLLSYTALISIPQSFVAMNPRKTSVRSLDNALMNETPPGALCFDEEVCSCCVFIFCCDVFYILL